MADFILISNSDDCDMIGRLESVKSELKKLQDAYAEKCQIAISEIDNHIVAMYEKEKLLKVIAEQAETIKRLKDTIKHLTEDESNDDSKDARKHILDTHRNMKRQIEYSGLNNRTIHILRCAGIETIGELAMMSKGKLLSLRNCGVTTVNCIEKVLAEYNLKLGMNECEYGLS